MTPNKPTNKSTTTTKSTKESVPTESGASTLPQIILGRPHNMPRRLMNVGASRTNTSGRE